LPQSLGEPSKENPRMGQWLKITFSFIMKQKNLINNSFFYRVLLVLTNKKISQHWLIYIGLSTTTQKTTPYFISFHL
jgi:oligoribonuclease (3'-5' exoribonuclease)